MKLSAKFSLAYLVLVSVVLVLSGWYYLRVQEREVEVARRISEQEAEQLGRLLEERLTSYEVSLRGLVANSELVGAIEGGGELRREVEQLFARVITLQPIVDQVRLLDRQGQEVVRVNAKGGGYEIVSKELLQDKAGRYYFEEGIKTPVGVTYYSKIDLNIENGEVEIPYKPMLRMSQVLVDREGEVRGMVVVNILAKDLFGLVKLEDSQAETYIVGEEGEYYYYPQEQSKEFAVFLGGQERDKHYLENKEQVFSQGVSSHIIEGNSGSELLAHRVVWLGRAETARPMVVMVRRPFANILAQIEGYRWQMLVGILSWIGISYLVINRWIMVGIVRRIKKKKAVIEQIGRGNFSTQVEVEGKDEIAEVAEGINRMVKEIRLRDKEREARERELETLKKELEEQQMALLNVLEDVNEEKELESSRNKLLLEVVREGVVIVDEEGKVEYLNPEFEKMFGYTQEDLSSVVLAQELKLFDVKDRELPAEVLSSSALVTAEEEVQIQILHKDGEQKVAVAVSAAPIYRAGEFRGVVMVLHDFSANLALQRQKDDFFSIASHELRTPLTVISGNLDLIKSGVGGSKLTKEDKEMLQDTLQASDRLTRMVADFLNVSRLDQGRLKLHQDEVEMCRLAQEVAEELRFLVEEKGVKLVVECPQNEVKVKGDQDKLREVLVNLVGNSAKFTEKGEIRIAGEVKGEMLEVRVSDTGIGIAKKMQDKLFGRFQQAMSRTLSREAGGTGLGLYISREFVRLMGGKLWLKESRLGKGTTFAFTVPIIQNTRKVGESVSQSGSVPDDQMAGGAEKSTESKTKKGGKKKTTKGKGKGKKER